ncbi:unnamed protein product [Arctia plantaginis]|uniref:Ig-like domain-containing protein n=1 Tax=Arctia plantaginis TaxID=874455 RepID=A0A8S1A0C2_ARCPL|nr:unnamed protein product [Arctia plantaginis]
MCIVAGAGRGAMGALTWPLLFASLLTACWGELSMLGPSLVVEPDARVQYAAARGVSVRCAARGHPPPTVTWLADDGTTLRDIPSVKRIHSNGTLEMLPTSGGYQVSEATVRCRAVNAHGVALSRDVSLQPVVDNGWDVVVSAPTAVLGGVGAVTCAATSQAALVRPALWYRADTVLHIDAPNPSIYDVSAFIKFFTVINTFNIGSKNSRHIVAGNTLLIRDVAASDAVAYSCLARHALTATTKRARPAHLTVTPTSANSAPRLVSPGAELRLPAGHDVCLPCVATDLKQPHYTWYRELNGRLEPVGSESPASWSWAGGAAQCLRRVTGASTGLWICKAYNVYGDATAHITLNVQDALTVTVEPTVLVADTGSTARFTCSSSDSGAALSWLHNGAPVAAGAELSLRGVARSHRGVYQCVARRGTDSSQAAAELRLGGDKPVPEIACDAVFHTVVDEAHTRTDFDWTHYEECPIVLSSVMGSKEFHISGVVLVRFDGNVNLLDSAPELHYTFIEQALRPGGSVSLRCAASASPPPRFSWLLDDQPLDQYFISSETSLTGDVVSVLNMSAVTPGDGGRYTCRAHNERGHAQHSARLNIYGPPSIRALGPVRVVAGANATIYCPYAGYPISSISWWRRGASVAVGGAGRVSARGSELRLAPALPADAGHYACAVAAPQGPAARRDIDIQVRNPPKISPFMFSSELTEGSSVQVLCGVSSGDKPMYFSWLKDEAPLPANLQVFNKDNEIRCVL